MGKQLLIIGNGFDLYCGLKSKYCDFYESDIKNKFSKYSRDNPENFWHTLLCQHDKNSQNYNWCDVEKIIKNTLNSINLKHNSGVALWDEAIIEFHNWNKHHSLRSYFLEYSDTPEEFILFYCFAYIKKIGYPDKEKFNEFLLAELKSFEKLFCNYLKKWAKYDEKYCEKAIKLFIDLTGMTLSPNQKSLMPIFVDFQNVHILSFNYTAPLKINMKKVYSCNPPESYSNVHGELCDESCESCVGSTIIFGIDDRAVNKDDRAVNKEDNNDSNLRLFSKTYRTLFSNGSESAFLPKCNDSNPLVIKFFGHSLNDADYSYFQSIFDYYNIYDNYNVSLIFYYAPFKDGIKDETVAAVYDLINVYGKTRSNKDQGKNLMHKLILERRIKIKEIKER